MAGRRMTLSRRTAFIVDSVAMGAVATSITPDRAMVRDSLVEIVITGTSGAGTVTVNGNVSGAPTAEILTFSGPGTLVTVNRFDAGTITTIDYSIGFSASNAITAAAVGSDGSRQQIHYTVASSIRARLDRGRGSWLSADAGRVEYEKTRIYVDYTTLFTPRDGDVWIDEVTGEEWECKTHPDLFGGGSALPHHWEFEVERRKQASTT
jgi:hypothetical protein